MAKRWTSKEQEQAVVLAFAEYTAEEIASKLRRTKSSVSGMMYRYSYPSPLNHGVKLFNEETQEWEN